MQIIDHGNHFMADGFCMLTIAQWYERGNLIKDDQQHEPHTSHFVCMKTYKTNKLSSIEMESNRK